MPSESEPATFRTDWGPLIRSIAAQQDRAAFAALFEYFAPRIKAFMQRSGASEAESRGIGSGDDAGCLAQGRDCLTRRARRCGLDFHDCA